MQEQDCIAAIATPNGKSAIAVIRISGKNAIAIVDEIFVGKILKNEKSHTLHFGKIIDENKIIDEVLVSIFKNPHSYTGEESVEISCHGSTFVVKEILNLLLKKNIRLATAGEFTQRAFMNGKLDLSQAESVADLIDAENKGQHQLAIKQMRGGYSSLIENLRQELIDFTALLELELDFSEEDVEFADREKFLTLIQKIKKVIAELIQSFRYGNVLKNGVPVALVGEPNVGKSTLLNALLNEEKAIVSEIAGTTRDFIEDEIQIEGISFRFIDTAGLRKTDDILESKGIERSFQKLKDAEIVLYLADINKDYKEIAAMVNEMTFSAAQKVIVVLNKSDKMNNCDAYDIEEAISTLTSFKTIEIAATTKRNLEKLKNLLVETIEQQKINTDIQVSNIRHLDALQNAFINLEKVEEGLHHKISGEFISIDARMALENLGSITGKITNEDVLSSVFSRFCIGK
ncbi:MAG: tRNA uridine-5-carboxymethylaminomethyl(34) synthesis GTPase MnmE [Chitinophagaceae bacterium]|nr:tRNA uridine-5-carboxymethylaminomethyl(34) synthesis GTPase MnmE [Chitinophagaceae bacterium]